MIRMPPDQSSEIEDIRDSMDIVLDEICADHCYGENVAMRTECRNNLHDGNDHCPVALLMDRMNRLVRSVGGTLPCV